MCTHVFNILCFNFSSGPIKVILVTYVHNILPLQGRPDKMESKGGEENSVGTDGDETFTLRQHQKNRTPDHTSNHTATHPNVSDFVGVVVVVTVMVVVVVMVEVVAGHHVHPLVRVVRLLVQVRSGQAKAHTHRKRSVSR